MMTDQTAQRDHEVLKVFEIDGSNETKALVIVTAVSVTVVEISTGTITKSYYFPNEFVLIDVIYWANFHLFAVATKKVVVVVPYNCSSPSEYVVETWPLPIKRLLWLSVAGEFLVICEDGFVAYSGIKEGRIYSPPVSTAVRLFADTDTLDVCFNSLTQQFAVIGKSASKGKRSTASHQYSLWVCHRSYLKSLFSPSSAAWLEFNRHEWTQIGLDGSLPSDLQSIKLSSNPTSFGFFVVIFSSSHSRWLKFNSEGEILFSKKLLVPSTSSNSHLQQFSEYLYMWSLDWKEVFVYDARFGNEVGQLSITSPPPSSSKLQLFCTSFPVRCYSIQFATTNGLSGVEYRAAVTEIALHKKIQPLSSFFTRIGKDYNWATRAVGEKQSDETIQAMKNNIYFYYRRIYQEEHVSLVNETVESGKKWKAKAFYASLEVKTIHDFLLYFNSLEEDGGADQIGSLYWEFMKVCIRSGMVSMLKNPLLIKQSILYHRIDVLSEMIQHVIDMTEYQIFSIFYYLFNLSSCQEAKFAGFGRTIVRNDEYLQNILLQIVAKTGNSAVNVDETTLKKRKHSATTAKPSSNFESILYPLKAIQIIQFVLGGFLSRTSFYSSVLLSETILKAIPNVSMICILVRLITSILQDAFSFGVEDSTNLKRLRLKKHYHFAKFTTKQFNNLLTLLEGIIDGCFISFTLTIQPQSISGAKKDIIACVSSLIQLIQTAEESNQLLSSLRSIVAVYQRAVNHQRQQTKHDSLGVQYNEINRKPPLHYYSQEKISL